MGNLIFLPTGKIFEVNGARLGMLLAIPVLLELLDTFSLAHRRYGGLWKRFRPDHDWAFICQ